jgi:hypothetical protein
MAIKLHLFDSAAVTRSVLTGATITAPCGLTKAVTRDDVEAAVDPANSVCKRCMVAAGEVGRKSGITIHKAEGWTKHLEREARKKVWGYTVTTSSAVAWSFPLAG